MNYPTFDQLAAAIRLGYTTRGTAKSIRTELDLLPWVHRSALVSALGYVNICVHVSLFRWFWPPSRRALGALIRAEIPAGVVFDLRVVPVLPFRK